MIMAKLKAKWMQNRKKYITYVIVALVVFTAIAVFAFINRPMTRERFIASLTREDFIYDVDYMLTMLEENFPSFAIIYNRNGVDMHEMGRAVREYIANPDNEIDFYRFWEVLRYDYFAHARHMGHLGTMSQWGIYHWLGPQYNRHFVNFAEGLNSPHSVLIYLPIPLEVREDVAAENNRETNVTMEIIEDGKIAYLRVNAFLRHVGNSERRLVNSFYEEIADFDHLIIDLRGNRGGWPEYFNELIAGPLLSSTLYAHFLHFVPSNNRAFDSMRASGLSVRMRHQANIGRLGDILDEYAHYTADFNYFHLETRRVDPVRRGGVRQGDFGWGFGGRIWMLIDGDMFSGSQIVAEFSKQTGFATLVGELTGGAAPAPPPLTSSFFALPNTGIIIRYDPTFVTNRYGRPMEYGTVPHYFNRPGMDALETVLAMIAEGSY